MVFKWQCWCERGGEEVLQSSTHSVPAGWKGGQTSRAIAVNATATTVRVSFADVTTGIPAVCGSTGMAAGRQ